MTVHALVYITSFLYYQSLISTDKHVAGNDAVVLSDN